MYNKYKKMTNTNKILNYFDMAYYINLDSRTDRKLETEKQLSKVGINAIRYGTIEPKDKDDYPDIGNKGCAESHFDLITQARNKNLNNILIFEDDIIFNEKFNNVIYHIVNQLKLIQWDMFYFHVLSPLGIHIPNDGKYEIKKIKDTVCTHAYAINNSIFDKILSLKENKFKMGIDWMYVFNIHPNHNIYAVNWLITQSGSKSDIQKWYNLNQ